MKKFILLITVVFSVTVTRAQWESDVRLTIDPDSSVTSYNQAWCIASDGDLVHVVWYDNRDGNWEIYYKQSADGGISWDVDERLTNDPANSSSPAIAASENNVHVVWRDDRDGNREIYYKRSTDGGVTWSADVRLTTDPYASSVPSISVSGSLVHLIWRDDRDGNTEIYYKRSPDAGATWEADIRLTNDFNQSYNPSLAASGSGVHVVWNDDREGTVKIFYKQSTDGGINWGEDTRLIDTYLAQLPSVAVSGPNIHVAWNELVTSGNFDIFYKRSTDGGQNWEEGQWLTAISGTSKCINLSVSGSFIHAVWEDDREGNYGIYYKRSEDEGLNWSLDTLLSDNGSGKAEHPSVATAGSAVHVLWYDDRDGNFEVYYKRNPTGGFPVGSHNQVTDNSGEKIEIYPDPATDLCNIRFQSTSEEDLSLRIIDLRGRVSGWYALKSSIGTNQYIIDLNDFVNGIYFLEFTSANQMYMKKMVIRK